jgi:hypothetical protein
MFKRLRVEACKVFAVHKRLAHCFVLHHAGRIVFDGDAREAKEDAAADFAAFDLGNYDRRYSAPHRSGTQESARGKTFQRIFLSIQNYFNQACFGPTGSRDARFSRAADVLTFLV